LKIDGCMLSFGLTEPLVVAAVDLNEDQFLMNGYRLRAHTELQLVFQRATSGRV
jgi:S-adenosylmethionine:diacylglycerol 3-amino-3-carboxypropyl transferase